MPTKLATLLAEIYANPRDDGPRLVLADALQEAGDPRGEFIALQCRRTPGDAAATPREAALLRKHGKAWMAPLAPELRTTGLVDPRGKPQFRRGFLAAATVRGSLESPAWATLDEVTFATSHIAREIRRNARVLRFPDLDALTGGKPFAAEEVELRIRDLDAADRFAATDRLPALTRVRIDGHINALSRSVYAAQLALVAIDPHDRTAATAFIREAPEHFAALQTLILQLRFFGASSEWLYKNALALTRDASGAFTVGRIDHVFAQYADGPFAEGLRNILANVPLTSLAITSVDEVPATAQATLVREARAAGIAELDLTAVGGELHTFAAKPTGKRKAKAKPRPAVTLTNVTQVAFEGDALFVGTAEGVTVLAASDLAPRGVWECEDRVGALAASRDYVAASSYSTVRVFDRRTGKRLHRIQPGAVFNICGIAFAPDAKKLVVGSENYKVCLIDAQTGEYGPPMKFHTSYVNDVAISPDGALIATASLDNTGRLVDVAKRRVKKQLVGHGGSVTAVAFAPDGTRLVTASYDATVRAWSLEGVELAKHTRAPVAPDDAFKGSQAVGVAPDGTWLAVAWNDGDVTLHDPTTLAVTRRITVQPSLELEDLAIAPDGKRVVVSHDDGIAVIDVATAKVVTRL